MLKNQILSHLEKIEQQQLAVGLNSLSFSEQDSFLGQLQSYGLDLIHKQRKALFQSLLPKKIEPLLSYDTAALDKRGEAAFAGCLLLCGGQGSRLCSNDPKALFPVTRIRKKTLLQIFCEKAAAASKKLGKALPLAIMTSPLNHDKIAAYLAEKSNFGLQIDLFSQQMLPFLDDRGNWLLESPGKIATGPDGNGHALKLFSQAGISAKWKSQGIRSVNIVPIDNPLADPFDAELVSFHEQGGQDVTIKAIFRHDAHEKVGVVGVQAGKTAILEYTDLPQDSASFTIGNSGLFCMSLSFIEKTAHIDLPWHLARKTTTVKIWKLETYIFDLLDFAARTSTLIYPREEIYAPLKNASGDKSIDTVQSALSLQDRKTFERLTGSSIPDRPFELDPAFYYPSPELYADWKGKNLPQEDYIDSKRSIG